MKRNNLIIYYAIILQVVTALFLLFSFVPIRVASLGVFYQIFMVPQVGALLMLSGVVLSIFGLLIKTKNRLRFLFFLPQFGFLILTSASALSYVIQGHYADGVIRPWQFIFIDQIHSLILVFLYTLAIFNFRKEQHVTTEIGEVINEK